MPGPFYRHLSIFLILWLGWLGACRQVQAAQLEAIHHHESSADQLEIRLLLDHEAVRPLTFTTDHPPRIVLDLPQTESGLKQKTLWMTNDLVHRISAVEADGMTRVVISLLKPTVHQVSVQGREIHIQITSEKAHQIPNLDLADMAMLHHIDFKPDPQGGGKVQIHLSRGGVPTHIYQQGQEIAVDLFNTRLSAGLGEVLQTDFIPPIRKITARTGAHGVRVVIQTMANFTYLAYQRNHIHTLAFRPSPIVVQLDQPIVEGTYTGEPLSLNFQDIPLRSVLQLLADFTGLNIIVNDSVTGNITLRLRDVPWDQALDMILRTKGLSMRGEGNVILVAPTEELAAREKLELESQIQKADLVPLRSALIPVSYAKASDLAALLKSTDNRLLSERGNVSMDERTNTLLVQDIPAKLSEIRQLIRELDVQIRQVLIESRIVIANDDFARDLGVRLGADYYAGGSTNLGLGGGLPGDMAWDPKVGQTMIENPAGSGNQALLVNLPQTLATGSGGAMNFVLGKVGQHLLRLELSAMQQEGQGEIISSPRVITSDQNKAIIKQGMEIPYQEATSNGATSVSFKEAVLQLEVIPHITPDNRVIMDLKVNKDNPDFTRAVLGVPPVDTRELQTTVLVDHGETVVLGGIFERTQARRIAKIPLLGDLPLLGVMFRQHQVQDEKHELLIFVTPHILVDGQAAQAAGQRRINPLK